MLANRSFSALFTGVTGSQFSPPTSSNSSGGAGGRAHTLGGAHTAGQGTQLDHSDPGQLGHGVSAYRDGDRHVRQRAVLEGEAQHVRLVVG